MPFDGSGNFNRVMNWVNDAIANIKIKADRHDSEDDNFAAGLSNTITKDGQSQPTANIPMNGKRITNLANPVNPADAMTLAQMVASNVRYDVAQALTLAQLMQEHVNVDDTVATLNRSTAYTMLLSDRNKLLWISADCSITLPAAATVGNDWAVDFRTRTGTVTLVPTGADTIDGQPANYVIPQGQTGRIWSMGPGNGYLVSIYASKAPTFTDITATGSYTIKPGCTHIEVDGCAAGSAGGGTIGLTGGCGVGGGGGGGGFGPLGKVFAVSSGASPLAVVVAAATPGVAGSTAHGGDTSITIAGVTYTWNGGIGGNPATATVNGNISAGGGGGTGTGFVAGGNAGGNAIATGPTGGLTGEGGATPFGTGGAPQRAVATSGGLNGNGYGAGGSGGATVNSGGNRVGGTGTQGFIRIKEYYGLAT